MTSGERPGPRVNYDFDDGVLYGRAYAAMACGDTAMTAECQPQLEGTAQAVIDEAFIDFNNSYELYCTPQKPELVAFGRFTEELVLLKEVMALRATVAAQKKPGVGERIKHTLADATRAAVLGGLCTVNALVAAEPYDGHAIMNGLRTVTTTIVDANTELLSRAFDGQLSGAREMTRRTGGISSSVHDSHLVTGGPDNSIPNVEDTRNP
ncbi:MAG TPA: hypothetical protein VF572_07245 [Candidatus Saccharimonadales bacterium]|jgi:hypothetical protein